MFLALKNSIVIFAACIALMHSAVIHSHHDTHGNITFTNPEKNTTATWFNWLQLIFQNGPSNADSLFLDIESSDTTKESDWTTHFIFIPPNLLHSDYSFFEITHHLPDYLHPAFIKKTFRFKILRGPPTHA